MSARVKLQSLCIASFAVVVAAGCARDAPRNGEDVLRIRSPDQNFEAVVRQVDIDGSIMVSQPYQVLVRSLVIDPDEFRVILSSDKTHGLKLRWAETGELEICYGSARIHGFTNAFVAMRPKPLLLQEVEVLLQRSKSLEECLHAPAGK